MTFIARFTPRSMSAAQYEECIRRLEQAGQGSPVGRLYHVCFGDAEALRVTDVWDSRENFERFGQTLMPILTDLGIDAGHPDIIEVHNIIKG